MKFLTTKISQSTVVCTYVCIYTYVRTYLVIFNEVPINFHIYTSAIYVCTYNYNAGQDKNVLPVQRQRSRSTPAYFEDNHSQTKVPG